MAKIDMQQNDDDEEEEEESTGNTTQFWLVDFTGLKKNNTLTKTTWPLQCKATQVFFWLYHIYAYKDEKIYI